MLTHDSHLAPDVHPVWPTNFFEDGIVLARGDHRGPHGREIGTVSDDLCLVVIPRNHRPAYSNGAGCGRPGAASLSLSGM